MKENNTTTDASRAAQATTHALKTPTELQQPQLPQPPQPPQPQKTKLGWNIPARHWQLIFKVVGAEAYDLIQSIEEGVPNRPNDSACNEVKCLLFTIRRLAERISPLPATLALATLGPATPAPATPAPATPAPATSALATPALATLAPTTIAPATVAPATEALATIAPATIALATPATPATPAIPALPILKGKPRKGVIQCYRCFGFNHIANACKKP